MSAYALPGLFPPIEPASPSSETSTSSSINVEESGNGPLHEQDSSTLSSLLKASVDRFCPPLLSPSSCAQEPFRDEMPGIQVKEAKIDPVRLVQCVTQNPKIQTQSSRKSPMGRRNSKDRLNDSPQRSPNSKPNIFSDEEAIQFELSISFDGRNYTATRTMQCIIQLRDDLISEMNNRQRWLQIRKSNERASTDCSQFSTSAGEDISVQIPEIPPLTGDDSGPAVGAGFVGRGFSMLHAMVTSYAPTMDRWLRNVLAIVPQDSECLMNFLWEPLPSDFPVDFASKSCASLATLGSIKELDFHSDDSESEDEWEG